MFDFSNILEFLSNNTEWINWAAFILVFLESLIILNKEFLITKIEGNIIEKEQNFLLPINDQINQLNIQEKENYMKLLKLFQLQN